MISKVAILISDVHFTLNTLEVAKYCYLRAIDAAAELKVPLIDLGDITNDKAIIRAEVFNTILEVFEYAKSKNVNIYLLVGNHSKINEKSPESAIDVLKGYVAQYINQPTKLQIRGITSEIRAIPYTHGLNENFFKQFIPGTLLFMHQGFHGADMGDYIQDKSAIPIDWVYKFNVFSGHYHNHQKIGPVVYIGNPYTLTFGEAKDNPKGFIILNSDLSYTRTILDCRAHIIIEIEDGKELPSIVASEEDIVKIRYIIHENNIKKFDRNKLANQLGINKFKIEFNIIKDKVSKMDFLMRYSDPKTRLREFLNNNLNTLDYNSTMDILRRIEGNEKIK